MSPKESPSRKSTCVRLRTRSQSRRTGSGAAGGDLAFFVGMDVSGQDAQPLGVFHRKRLKVSVLFQIRGHRLVRHPLVALRLRKLLQVRIQVRQEKLLQDFDLELKRNSLSLSRLESAVEKVREELIKLFLGERINRFFKLFLSEEYSSVAKRTNPS